jgi:hypothetical protein
VSIIAYGSKTLTLYQQNMLTGFKTDADATQPDLVIGRLSHKM